MLSLPVRRLTLELSRSCRRTLAVNLFKLPSGFKLKFGEAASGVGSGSESLSGSHRRRARGRGHRDLNSESKINSVTFRGYKKPPFSSWFLFGHKFGDLYWVRKARAEAGVQHHAIWLITGYNCSLCFLPSIVNVPRGRPGRSSLAH
eukprot:2636962-Rhodomonas_salina.2